MLLLLLFRSFSSIFSCPEGIVHTTATALEDNFAIWILNMMMENCW